MAKRPFKFYVEMEGNSYSPVGEIKQLDTMELDITVTENGVPKDLSGSEISLYVRKKDRTILEQKENISIVTASEGTIKIKVKNQATTCIGMTLFELELKGSDGVATSGTFIFNVTERVVNGEVVISKDEVHALAEIEKYVAAARIELENFKRLQNKMLETNETINGNESERVLAEIERIRAEESRVLAENERVKQFKTFENRVVKNEKEITGARTATTGEEFNSLDERIDCEVERLNEKIEFSFLQQEDSEKHIIKNTVEGMTKDMIVKGRTLHNLLPLLGNYNMINSITSSKVSLFKLNTEYTMIVRIKNSKNPKNLSALLGRFYRTSNNTAITVLDNQVIKDGEYKAKFTIDENVKSFEGLWGRTQEQAGDIVCDYEYIFLEGDWTNKEAPSYFEGVKSFGEQEGNKIINLSIGKNLVDIKKAKVTDAGIESTIENNSIILKTNEEIANWSGVEIDFFLPKGKWSFRYKGEGNGYLNANIFYLSKGDKMTITGDVKPDVFKDFTTNSSRIVTLKLLLKSNSTTNVLLNKYYNIELIPFELKNTIFEPYSEDKKDILLSKYGFDDGLRGLNETIFDELNSIRQVAIKRVEKYIINGNEEIVSSLRDGYIYCRLRLIGSKPKSGNEAVCNQFVYIDGLWNGDDPKVQGKEGFDLSGNDELSFQLSISKLETSNAEGVKKYFKSLYDSGNPVVVYFELAEPVETPLNENINSKTFGEKTYVRFENALSGTSFFKAPINTISALSTLTDDIEKKTDKKEAFNINKKATESLELSEYNHDDINNNIFPYIMDLELMVLDMMALNGYTNKKYKIMERAGLYMTSKQALERLIRQKKITLEDALERIVRYNDAKRISDAEALELTDLANEIL